jgi:hypothetical protein
MRGLKTLLCTSALLAPLALLPLANAQIAVNIGTPPSCSYGYYDYSPYACAPVGYYGSGYFYNGIFLGMGPWSGWGYNHGWGSHRFSSSGGGRYTGGFHGSANNRGRAGGASMMRANSRNDSHARSSPGPSHVAVRHSGAAHAKPSPGRSGGASHAAASRGGGSHGGGESHGGGGGSHGGHQ